MQPQQRLPRLLFTIQSSCPVSHDVACHVPHAITAFPLVWGMIISLETIYLLPGSGSMEPHFFHSKIFPYIFYIKVYIYLRPLTEHCLKDTGYFVSVTVMFPILLQRWWGWYIVVYSFPHLLLKYVLSTSICFFLQTSLYFLYKEKRKLNPELWDITKFCTLNTDTPKLIWIWLGWSICVLFICKLSTLKALKLVLLYT